jgi:hypothetical protein
MLAAIAPAATTTIAPRLTVTGSSTTGEKSIFPPMKTSRRAIPCRR